MKVHAYLGPPSVEGMRTILRLIRISQTIELELCKRMFSLEMLCISPSLLSDQDEQRYYQLCTGVLRKRMYILRSVANVI